MPFEMEPIPPIWFLAELREEVLKHSLRRMPKWKFRLASDLVLQLQPKPTVLLSEAAAARGLKPKLQHFEGVAVMTEGVTGAVFKHLPRGPAPPRWQIKFELYSQSPDADWVFKRTSGYWQHGADRTGTGTIVQRLIAAFQGGFLDGSAPTEVLSPNCVICGKGLTDPASMARWIGPECAGTSSLRVPFVINASNAIQMKAA
jgi:Family of unknown function (DUF6011)